MNDYVEETYGDMPFTTYPRKLTRHLVMEYAMQAGQSILDVGCGRGEYLIGFIRQGMRGYGIDRFPRQAQMVCPQAKIWKDNIETGDIKHGPYNVIFLKSVIEHTKHPDSVLYQCWKALKPGGRIIVMTPNWEACYRTFYGDCTHYTPFTKDSLGQLLRLMDYRQVESDIFYCLPLYWEHPWLRPWIRFIGHFVPYDIGIKHKICFARPVMVLATGVK